MDSIYSSVAPSAGTDHSDGSDPSDGMASSSRAAVADVRIEDGLPGVTWLPLPDVARVLGLELGKIRRLLQERILIGARIGERKILSVPESLILDGQPLEALQGTLNVLRDAGFSDDEALRWLFTPDDTIPGTPVDALRAGRKTEIRRRAQAMAF